MSTRRLRPDARMAARLGVIFLALLTTARPGVAFGQNEAAKPGEVTKAPKPEPIDWKKTTDEAAKFLSQYIQINTTNPPGNEIKAAQILKDKFLTDGIPATIWQSAPGRGIVAARLRGVGRKRKAIILLSHMDVVPANPKEWSVPPFSGTIRDGSVWGRGALDDKGPGVIEMMAMLAIKRAGILLNRDVLFVATGDEETGGKQGAEWFANNEKDIYSDAHYLLNEGGAIMVRPNGSEIYAVSVTEKTPLWLRLTATGPAGHAADPAAETSVTHLIRALARLIDYRPKIHVLRPVANYFRVLAEVDRGPRQWFDLASSLHDPLFAREFVAVPYQNALVRDTLAPTVLAASPKINEVPQTAYADVDCRLLPGEKPKAFLETVRKVIADKSIKIQVLLTSPAISSPQRSPLMRAIEELAHKNKSRAVPTMISGFTDSRFFRHHGVISYGFIPIELSAADESGIHGINERVGVNQLGDAIRRMVTLLEIFGGRK